MNETAQGQQLHLVLESEMLAKIDDFRFSTRQPTRAAAVRELLKLGLEAAKSR